MHQADNKRNKKGYMAGIFNSFRFSAGLLVLLAFLAVYALFSRPAILSSKSFPRSREQFLPLNQLNEALRQTEEKLASNSEDPKALIERGMLEFQRGRDIEAIKSFEKARDKGALDVRIFYYLGVMYQSEGLYEFAKKEYLRFLNNKPGDFEVRMLLAKLFFIEGKFSEAVCEYEKVRRNYPDDSMALENLAFSQWKAGLSYEPAIEQLRKTDKLGRRADYCMGKIAYESKKYQQAIVSLQRIAADPEAVAQAGIEMTEIFRMLAGSYSGLKLNEFALAAWEKLLGLNPADEEAKTAAAKLKRTVKSSRRK